LDDITNTRKIVDVYLRGRRVDRIRLRQGFGATTAASSGTTKAVERN
jgi:hypothetical protein